jgi:peroxiredoxin
MRNSRFVFLTLPLLALAFIAANSRIQNLKVGDKAPNFKLKNVDGKQVSLTDSEFAKAKGFIVIFSCNHCPWVIKYEDRMIELDKKFHDSWPVIAISSNDANKYPADGPEQMAERAQEKGFTFPYLYDESQDVARKYGAQKTPHVYLLKKTGNDFVVSYIGAIDDNADNAKKVKNAYVEQAIEALEKGQAPSVQETKAIGCGIKWKNS